MEEMFAAAVRFFETGDDDSATSLFGNYIAAGGARKAEALEYLQRIRREPSAGSVRVGEGRGEGLESTAGQAGPPSLDRVVRYPHLETGDASLAPGQAFRAVVYTDSKGSGQGISLPGDGQESFELTVRLLASAHFLIAGEAAQVLHIDRRQERSADLVFSLAVADQATLAGLPAAPAPSLTAAFTYQDRPAGSVTRAISIQGLATAAPEAPAPRLSVEPAAQPADLTVVVTASAGNDNRHFWCTVSTPLLDAFRGGVTQEWNLPDTAFNIVKGFMAEFTASGVGPLMRIASLRGAGKQLYDAAPQNFKDAYWGLVDKGAPLRTVAVISAEPHIPWELMIPHRAAPGKRRSETALPLGVGASVGRWTSRAGAPAPQAIPLNDSFVIAPNFSGPAALPKAQEEARKVVGSFQPGTVISPATGESINQALAAGGRSLLHIACHGQSGDTAQVLLLDQNQKLTSTQLSGLPGVEAGFGSQPMVFLNACEVGRLTPSLSGAGGFAESFIELGASAVIAPLWSVKDAIAHDLAIDFYDAVAASPQTPFAEILRGQRAKAYDINVGEDTYAAYCFYGDPLARRAQ